MNVLNRRQALQRALLNGKNKQDAYHPFPWYESMRKDAPVSFDEENQVWSVFLYDDVKKLLGIKSCFPVTCRSRQALLEIPSLTWTRRSIQKSVQS